MTDAVKHLHPAVALMLALAATGVWGVASSAAPSAPVRVEFDRPAPVQPGEEATTVITFRALADLDRLEVSVAAYKGLVIVSSQTRAAFENVKENEGRPLTVTVRLTDSKAGTLAIFFTTTAGATRQSGTTGITFGTSR